MKAEFLGIIAAEIIDKEVLIRMRQYASERNELIKEMNNLRKGAGRPIKDLTDEVRTELLRKHNLLGILASTETVSEDENNNI